MTGRSFAAFVIMLQLCLTCSSALAGSTPAAQSAPQQAPSSEPAPAAQSDSSITYSFQEIGSGLGYEWGKGTLHHNGETYAFKIGGGGIVSFGYISVTGTGKVKNLNKLEQFDGTYWTVKADAAVGSGTGVAVLENQYGVQLVLTMSTKGAHVGASVMRLRFKLLPRAGEKLASH